MIITDTSMFASPSPALPATASGVDNAGSGSAAKRKRRPAGTPDPEAEVVSLSPRTLLESDRYVCEICNQGFQRDQNLQMHRRRHKVPWKLLKRESGAEARKRVFVCPEPSCLHHDPAHALGDLVGIKKHFRRKHSAHKQWSCARCSKAYAVHSDYKAHLKTCGTRGHSCDCGRVFSRVESFIEHQDTCDAGRVRPEIEGQPQACLSRIASSLSPSSDHNNFMFNTPLEPLLPATAPGAGIWPALPVHKPVAAAAAFLKPDQAIAQSAPHLFRPSIELQLLPKTKARAAEPAIPSTAPSFAESQTTILELSIGPWIANEKQMAATSVTRMKDEAKEQLSQAMAEKARAEEARQQAKRQMEIAEQEFTNAKRIRQQAQLELNKAFTLRDHASKKIHSTLLQVTCFSCNQQFHCKPMAAAQMLIADDNSLAASYISSVVTEDEGED